MFPPPYRTKVVEEISLIPIQERIEVIRKAGYNPFLIPQNKVFVDLISDSGTSAMSAKQWAFLIESDEAFSYQDSYDAFVSKVKSLTGYRYILPVHQARAAEHILFRSLIKEGDTAIANTFFSTTQEHISLLGATPINLLTKNKKFLGNLNIERAEEVLKKKRVGFILLSITNNIQGGQPVSLKNLREAKRICQKYKVPLILDACRFAENLFLIKEREEGYARKSIPSIAKEVFSLADITYLSAKKDGLSNIGGFIALNDKELANRLESLIGLFEGFPSHGGLTGRDMAAMTQGLSEALDHRHLRFRIEQVRFLAERLKKEGVPILEPVGGHAVCIDPYKFAPYLKRFGAYSLASQVYIQGGVRGGVFIEGREIYRLAIPRRVYANTHLEYTAQIIGEVYKRQKLPLLRCIYQPKYLRSFLSKFRE